MDALDVFDLFDIESQLTDEERLVRDTVGRFVDTAVLPIIGQCFADHRFPAELVPKLAELGLLGSTVDGYGGAGLNHVAYGLVCQELERGDGGLRSFVSVQSSLAVGAIERFGSAEQRERWLPALVGGQAIGCFALTEPQGGSDPGSMRTRAEPDGDDFVLHGSKIWITSGSIADVAVVWAAAPDGIGGFLVERGAAGFDARDIERKMSMRASVTSELYFDGVRVPARNRLPGAAGLKAPLSLLSDARFGIVWGALGAARACFEEALEFAKSRNVFGRPLAHTQAVQLRLADMARRLTSAQLLALRLGRLKDEGRAHATQISLAKWNNVRMALDIARDCRDLLGAAGIVTEHSAIRHMLNLESVVTYEGAETVHELVVGKQLTGHSAF